MKKVPMLLLLIAPYVVLFLCDQTGLDFLAGLWIYGALLAFNMVYAFLLPRLGFKVKQLLFWNLLLKLCHMEGTGSAVMSGGDVYGDSVTINSGNITISAGNNGLSAKEDILINGGTLTITAGEYAVHASSDSKIIVNGGTVDATSVNTTADSDYYALGADSITIDSGLSVKASTEPDGTLVDYVAANNKTYDRVVIRRPAEYVGGVTATGGKVAYDSSLCAYAPVYSTLYAVDTFGEEVCNDATVSGLYTTRSGDSLSNPLTTDPVDGTTYYAYITLQNPGGIYYIDSDLIDIQIGGYKVTYLASYERNMGFSIRVVYSVTKLPSEIWVGGVGIPNGHYLANGSTTPTAAKPSAGYAYYNNKTLTLHNYSHSGAGYNMGSGLMANIYAPSNVTVKLSGTNSLISTALYGYGIYCGATVTIAGDGVLTISSTQCGIRGSYGVIVSSGTVNVNGGQYGIYGNYVTVKGGTVSARSRNGTGADYAIRTDNTFEVASSLTVVASTATTGPYSAFEMAKLNTYDRILISQGYVYVGGIHLPDGFYLAKGSTTPTTTKPSAGYAHYDHSDKVLTLHNYSYSGQGYDMISGLTAAIYLPTNATVKLSGTNTLTQTATTDGYGIYCDRVVTVAGDGSLTISSTHCGIRGSYGIIVNSGAVEVSGNKYGIYGSYVTVNGGTVTAKSLGGTGMDYAVRSDNSFSVANDLAIMASTEPDGALVAYVAANNNTYDHIQIGPKPTGTLGDLNLDGQVNSDDLTLLARHVGGIETVFGQALTNADVNSDGLVNSDDLTKHARYVGGIITDWNQE